MKKKDALREGFSPLTITMLVILSLYVVCLLVLLLWGGMQIFKPASDFKNSPIWFPPLEDFTFDNFRAMVEYTKMDSWLKAGIKFKTVGFVDIIVNSIIYALGGSFVQTLSMCIMAYLAGRYSYFYSKIIYTVVIVVMIVPIVGSQMSEIEMLNAMGLYDTRFGFIILKAGFVGMYFLVFYETFKGIPMTYTEAAMMDGASDWCIMFRVCMPLVLNVFGTIMLINFIQFWNDYQMALLYMPSYPTLSYFLYTVQTYGFRVKVNGKSINTDTVPVKMATTFTLMLPILILFILLNKKLMGNLSIGGIKG